MAAADMQLAERLVDAINELSGAHPGHRAAHARGTLCAGRFIADPGAARLSRAGHLQGEPVRVTARFSNGSGNPNAPDNDRRDGRGLAVKFYLPQGGTTDIVALSLPVFFVATPEDFLGFTRARRPDPATGELDMETVGAFLSAHPDTAAALQLILPALVPPASYATCVYNGIHSFRLIDDRGEGHWIRYRFEPEAGEAALSDDEIEQADPEYLQHDIRQRLGQGPVRFSLLAQLAGRDDPIDDPTKQWPSERETRPLGVLELTGLETERETGDDVLVFDPTRITDGIECSADPILHVRSDAYAVSVLRRTGVARAG